MYVAVAVARSCSVCGLVCLEAESLRLLERVRKTASVGSLPRKYDCDNRPYQVSSQVEFACCGAETCSWWCCGRYRRKAGPVFDLLGFSTPLATCREWVRGTLNQEEPALRTLEPRALACRYNTCRVRSRRVRPPELTNSSQYLSGGAGAGAGARIGACFAVAAAVRGKRGKWGEWREMWWAQNSVYCSWQLQHTKTKEDTYR